MDLVAFRKIRGLDNIDTACGRIYSYKKYVMWIIVMLLSAVRTLILTAPIHCRGSTAEQVM